MVRASPNRLYKAPTDKTKPPKDYTKTQQTIQSPKILDNTFKKHAKPPKLLDKNHKYLTRVATNINLASNIKYPI